MENLRDKMRQLLQRSGGFFQTDVVYLVKGGSWLSLGQGVAIVAGFLLSITFANLFPKESFGTYKFIISTVGVVGAFSLTGIGIAITQAVAKNFGGALRQGFKTNLKWSIGMFFGGIGLSLYYYLNDNSVLSFSFLLAGFLSPIISSAGLYGSYLLGKKDFRRTSLFSIIQNVAPAAMLILTLIFTQNIIIIISVYFISSVVVLSLLYYMTRRAYRDENAEEDPRLLSYGKHLSAMDVIGKIASYLDKILIFHFLGAAPLAIYAFAIAPVEQLQSGKKMLSTLIMPKLSERPFEELQKSSPRKALMLTVYALGLAGVWALGAPYFYQLFFPQYLDSVFYSQIYALTLLAISGTIFNETLVAHKKTRELYLHRTITSVLQIILFLIFLPLYGLMGLIITHIIIRSFSGILGYYFVTHPFKASSN